MRLVFRKFPRSDVPPPASGEIHVRPGHKADEARLDLAAVVLERGLDACPRSAEPIESVVVSADPTLDDLLAATFLMRLLEGRPLPAGAAAFARYAALVREGLHPSNLSLEVSLEGIYLAIRNAAGADLTQSAVGTRFAADWARMANALLAAAEASQDPFTAALPVFATGPEFARERAFLTKDQEVYRQDVARGDRWRVTIPDGKTEGLALLLRQPKSLLFKSWSRRPQEAPPGPAYLLLAVDWGEGNWVFSTDPVQRLPIKTLAAALHAEETARAPTRAGKDPWFDGEPFGHTLVAAPRQGTVLPEEQILRVFKRWAGATATDPPARPPWQPFAFAAAGALVAVLVIVLTGVLRPPSPREALVARGFELDERDPAATGERGNLYVLAVGVSKYKNSKYNLNYARADAEGVIKAFRAQTGKLFGTVHFKALTDEHATRETLTEDIAAIRNHVTEKDLVVVSVSAHGATFRKADDFYFLPYDFDEAKPAASGVFWNTVKGWLEDLPCRVLIVMDTCHSGNVALTTVAQPNSRKAMVVIAACLSHGRAHEQDAWKHGALTLALLESITGKRLYEAQQLTPLPTGDGETATISLEHLQRYVKDRVRELVGKQQAVVVNQTPGSDYTQIPVAALKAAN
jgi:hypothetical protein